MRLANADRRAVMRRVILLLSTGKCGCTWLGHTVAVRPHIWIDGEQDFMIFLNWPRERQWNLRTLGDPRHAAILAARELSLSDRLVALYRLALPPAGYLLDKSPSNLWEIERFEHLFVDSRLLFLYRDPRDIYVSQELYHQEVLRVREAPPGGIGDPAYLESSASFLPQVFELALKLLSTEERLRRRGLATHRVRYEDLVTDFDGTVAGALRFLDVPPDGPGVRQHVQHHRTRRLPSFRRGGAGDWRNHIVAPAARRFLRDRYASTLQTLGYSPDDG
jgi:hypothetical protein